ncbi:hypothetical protein BVRB_3g048410 [Beta vulgaris subsp. vulgaris]|nr:hypothetical protein BVRB_3g048410 [Beta vulgaris subsp. vulgaris]
MHSELLASREAIAWAKDQGLRCIEFGNRVCSGKSIMSGTLKKKNRMEDIRAIAASIISSYYFFSLPR